MRHFCHTHGQKVLPNLCFRVDHAQLGPSRSQTSVDCQPVAMKATGHETDAPQTNTQERKVDLAIARSGCGFKNIRLVPPSANSARITIAAALTPH